MWKKLLLIGDSNTEWGYGLTRKGTFNPGWVSMLSDNLSRRIDVVNRGFGGYSSEFIKIILPRLLSEFPAENLAGVVVMVGTNDSGLKGFISHVDLEDYERNMNEIIDELLKKGIKKNKIIIISPPRIDEEKWAQTLQVINPSEANSHFDHVVKTYAEKAMTVAEQRGIKNRVDLYKAMETVNDWKNLLSDGIHLNEQGNQLLFSELQKVVKNEFVDIPNNFPVFSELKVNKTDFPQFPVNRQH
jgi:lysophospholipase L1-like esterase